MIFGSGYSQNLPTGFGSKYQTQDPSGVGSGALYLQPLEIVRSKIYQAWTTIACNIQPINCRCTEDIYSFSNWPAHDALNKRQTYIFFLLRQNVYRRYFALWGTISAENIWFMWNIIGWRGHVVWQAHYRTCLDQCI